TFKTPMIARILRTLAFASLAALLEAQSQGTISGPVAGYVCDKASQALRPVVGLPGASLLGAPLSFGYNVTAAFVAPTVDSALAVAADGSTHMFQIQGGNLQEVSVDGLPAAGLGFTVVFSPSGKAAALYAGNSVQVVTGLPNSPMVAGNV